MELKMFDFIEEATGALKKIRPELKEASEYIEEYFEDIIKDVNEGDLHVRTRVKSVSSLKEKIIRNNYYKIYKNPDELIDNLHDLIGVRLECRFIRDENELYKVLKNYFYIKHEDGYYYNDRNPDIRLELEGKQPQRQKNGFEIFRIDGVYHCTDRKINFELQIKSLVNVFWGEIEHKIIYKNNNYLIVDTFLKEIMQSIHKNLSMIDNQLLLVYNEYNKHNTIDPVIRKNQVEKMLSKIIYDIFSSKMKKSIGFIVDFRKSCDTVVEYIFKTQHAHDLDDYSETLLTTFNRLNEIGRNEVDFNSELKLEREVVVDSDFAKIITEEILNVLNVDFQWNLFFRIMFEIELGNNVEDFEAFIKFVTSEFYNNPDFSKLHAVFEKDHALEIKHSLMVNVAKAFKEVGTINFIYEKNIIKIKQDVSKYINLICENILNHEHWEKEKHIYEELIRINVLTILDAKVSRTDINKLIGEVKEISESNKELSESILYYLNNIM